MPVGAGILQRTIGTKIVDFLRTIRKIIRFYKGLSDITVDFSGFYPRVIKTVIVFSIT